MARDKSLYYFNRGSEQGMNGVVCESISRDGGNIGSTLDGSKPKGNTEQDSYQTRSLGEQNF